MELRGEWVGRRKDREMEKKNKRERQKNMYKIVLEYKKDGYGA